MYYAAFQLDPSGSGRSLATWLGRVTPMETEAVSGGRQPPKKAKKSRGGRAQPPPVA